MIISSILGALASKEILTILGLSTVTVISAAISKLCLYKSSSGEFFNQKAYVVGLAIHTIVLLALIGYSGVLYAELLKVVETIFFM